MAANVEQTAVMSDEELLARFEDGSLPNGAFHHEQHVRVAWMLVRRYGMPDALGRFSQALKRFAEAKGAVGLYHETMTWAYLFLVAERIARGPGESLGTLRRRQSGPADVETVAARSVLRPGDAQVGPGAPHVHHARQGAQCRDRTF